MIAAEIAQDGHVRASSLDGVDDQNISLTCPGLPFGNGPEWGASQATGHALYYGKRDGLIPYVARAIAARPETEPNDDAGQAAPIMSGLLYSGDMTAGDQDGYAVTVSADGSVRDEPATACTYLMDITVQ